MVLARVSEREREAIGKINQYISTLVKVQIARQA